MHKIEDLAFCENGDTDRPTDWEVVMMKFSSHYLLHEIKSRAVASSSNGRVKGCSLISSCELLKSHQQEDSRAYQKYISHVQR